ncbi:hypothetical protein MHUMG1_05283 [Metarhizium humberi]|uniref:Uncharacterized protein n=1 Tax=Metarhizium humberi TaxID=2596975 RepID=A0A9P8MAX5_9HYPO|nr:hypothetical protein MHUMG1_05283 [Metarhizium humberi]
MEGAKVTDPPSLRLGNAVLGTGQDAQVLEQRVRHTAAPQECVRARPYRVLGPARRCDALQPKTLARHSAGNEAPKLATRNRMEPTHQDDTSVTRHHEQMPTTSWTPNARLEQAWGTTEGGGGGVRRNGCKPFHH